MGFFRNKGFFGKTGAQNGPEEVSVAKEINRIKMFGLRDVIICLLVVGFFMLTKNSFNLGGYAGILPTLEETRFGITDLAGKDHFFTYKDADSIELFDDLKSFDKGELVEGTEKRTVTSGTFRNSEFGEYELHVQTKLHNYIVVHDANGVLVFNVESDDTTKQLYDYFIEQRNA